MKTHTGGSENDKSRARLMKELRTKVFGKDPQFFHDLKWFMHVSSLERKWLREEFKSTLKLLPNECCNGFSAYEQQKEATFAAMFDSLAEESREKLCVKILSAGEDKVKAAKDFVSNHYQFFLREMTHLLLFKCGNNFFVINVYVYVNGSLDVSVFCYKHAFVYSVSYHYRVVVPQLKA